MRHGYFGKQLSRTANERKNLFRNLLKSLFEHGSIRTTKTRAQAVRAQAEKMITRAKKPGDYSARVLLADIGDRKTVGRITELAKTAFAGRTSGYTRIIKLGSRRGDSAEEVLLAFVDDIVKTDVVAPVQKKETVTEPVKPAETKAKAPAKEKVKQEAAETKKPVRASRKK